MVVDLVFNRTHVPVQETSYWCQSFDIPNDREYHMFATKPIIDNAYVMHHTILYGCPADIDMGRWHSIFIASASFGLANITVLIQWTLNQLTKSNVWPWDYSLGGSIFQLSSLWFLIVKTLDFSKLIPNTRSIASTQIIVVVIISLGRPSNWFY